MDFMNEKERLMYENAGGDETGEIVVLKWRQYLEDYAKQMQEYAKETKRNKYHPKNEKSTATYCIDEDDYE